MTTLSFNVAPLQSSLYGECVQGHFDGQATTMTTVPITVRASLAFFRR